LSGKSLLAATRYPSRRGGLLDAIGSNHVFSDVFNVGEAKVSPAAILFRRRQRSWTSLPHEPVWDVFSDAALIIGNPGFGSLFGRKARYERRIGPRNKNFDTVA
jgi:hypothetical protein